jgi:transcriptional regulator with XRE-family HTH domain
LRSLKGGCDDGLSDPLDAPFGKAVDDRRVALGLSVADLARRAEMSTDEIGCIEEGGTEPTVALLRHLATMLDADVRLTAVTNSARSGSSPMRPD